MSKFKVGDVVRIKDLPVADHGGLFYNAEMQSLAGSVYVISRVYPSGRYDLKCCGWTWNDEMLEPVPEEYRNKKLYYKIGDPVLFHGEKTVVVHICDHRYCIRDYPEWVLFKDLEPIEGFDYDNYKVPAYNVGDIVVCKIKHDESYYGTLGVHRNMLKYAGKVGIITKVKHSNYNPEEEGARYECTFDNDSWTWNSLMVEKIGNTKGFEPNEKAIQLSDPPRLCIFNGEKFEGSDDEDLQTFVHVTEKNVKLRTDIFGIGEEGEIIKAYVAEITNQVLAAETTSKSIINALYEGEYTEV